MHNIIRCGYSSNKTVNSFQIFKVYPICKCMKETSSISLYLFSLNCTSNQSLWGGVGGGGVG